MYQRLLVPLDGSATAALALGEAAQLARLAGATVVLLHVVDAMDHVTGFEPPLVHIQEVRPTFLRNGQALLDAARQTLEAQGVTAETVLLESQGERVSQLIADQASQAGCDLIVLGTHGRRGVNRLLLGSDAEQVARIAAMPVMLVRPRGAGAPATRTTPTQG
ncbi:MULTISPECIES: universal stress protein [Pseudacidovorax]|uniref:universal stress protein n=1 Tax=Pseudacidovorax TaxID=433923 RepID=UPI001F4068D1|nr:MULTISPECIES: universal stress protein [Pseudacidovorax]